MLLVFTSSLLAINLVACEDPADKVTAAKVNNASQPKKAGITVRDTANAIEFKQNQGTIGFTGSKVTGKHDGGFKTFKGTINVVEENPEKSQFSVTIDMESTYSDSKKLTSHLKSADFFDTGSHSESSFHSTAIKQAGDKYEVTGNLKLHGVTKSITFPASITLSKEKIQLKSEFSINRKDFGISYKGRADDLIRDGVVIRLSFDVKR
jgi:polyisoprenoid-binding protein YceI